MSSAFSHRLVILRLAITTAARFFTAVVNRIDGRPRSTFSFLFGHATFFITFFDVASLSFFFVSVFVFVTSWYFSVSSC